MDSSTTDTPSSKKKSNRNAMDEFALLYVRKSEDSYAELRKQDKKHKISNELDNVQSETPKIDTPSGKSKKRHMKAVDCAQISINGSNLESSAAGGTPLNKSKVTSTPVTAKTKDKVKPIIKHTDTDHDETMDGSLNISKATSKKRNKSVSFLLEENEQAIVKKSKSEVITNKGKAKINKFKKDIKSEKENKVEDDQSVQKQAKITNQNLKRKNDKSKTEHLVSINQEEGHHVDIDISEKLIKDKSKKRKSQERTTAMVVPENQVKQEVNLEGRKHRKLNNAKKQNESAAQDKMDMETNKQVAEKTKQSKKNKFQNKHQNSNDVERNGHESVVKAIKKEVHPEIIADNLENLNLGDNTHTITNLLDEMVVVDTTKQKKKRKTANRLKKKSIDNKDQKPEAKDLVQDIEKISEGEEKKWANKRWNKKQKTKEQTIQVVVDNLPIALLFTYKKVLNEHFSKYGPVRTVGVAEVYPTEVSKPVFATTIYFATTEAATKALEEDGTVIKGGNIRVMPSRPMTETTLVMRSYGPLTDQAIVTGMTGVGKIRSIRQVVRGKKTMTTMFVEFDGPESVERAIERCSTFKVKGKKVRVDRFAFDNKKKPKKKSVRDSHSNGAVTFQDTSKQESQSDDDSDSDNE